MNSSSRKVLPCFGALILVVLLASELVIAQENRASNQEILVPIQRVDYIDEAAREPSIVEHPNGTLFVTGYGMGPNDTPQKVPRLWKSADGGATWNRVNVGSEADGALANSDVSLAAAPDGTLYLATMEFDHKTSEGQHIAVGASKDAGTSWHWTMLSKKRYDDRPWVAVAPDGTAHAIWNDGTGVYHSTSRDQGATWSQPDVINSSGGSSHLAMGPKGEVAVRIVPVSASGNMFTPGVDLIAISTDGGKTWSQREAPGKRDWAPMDTPGATPRWVEPLAWDSEGDLYSLWTDLKGIWLARSPDQGITWKQYQLAQPDALPYYPYLKARGPGELAATWFSGAGELLHWHICRVHLTGDHLQIAESAPLETQAWLKSEEPDHPMVRSSAGEYLTVTFLQNGDLAVATPIQKPSENRRGFTFWRFKNK